MPRTPLIGSVFSFHFQGCERAWANDGFAGNFQSGAYDTYARSVARCGRLCMGAQGGEEEEQRKEESVFHCSNIGEGGVKNKMGYNFRHLTGRKRAFLLPQQPNHLSHRFRLPPAHQPQHIRYPPAGPADIACHGGYHVVHLFDVGCSAQIG